MEIKIEPAAREYILAKSTAKAITVISKHRPGGC